MVIRAVNILLSAACLAPILAFSQVAANKAATPTEVFLLAPLLQYTYDYYHSESSSDELLSGSRIDSGVVEYVVVDSVHMNDTTAQWQVREYSMLWHRVISSVCPCDTTYSTADSVTIALYEQTSGMHSLRCSGIAWEFSNSPGASIVDRYADSSEVILVQGSSNANGSEFDSLRLSATSGLSFRESGSHSSFGFFLSSHETRFRLRGTPSSAAPDQVALPTHSELLQNYPNPFNPSTRIAYSVLNEGAVSLVVYDLLGREVATLVRETKQPGRYSVTWSAEGMPSGMYFYRLHAGPYGETKTMVLMR